MSASRPTYGDLMRVAQRHTAWASLGLVTERITDRAAAEAAFAAYREMFAAVRLHVERLVGGPRRVQGMAWSDWTSPSDRAALRLAETLATVRRPAEPSVAGHGQPCASWRASTRALGAAGDLLATHVAVTGLPRTPDAAAWSEGTVRAVGYAYLADMVSTLCAADRDLALRAGQAGLPWRSVARRLPVLDRVETAAHELHQVARQELGFARTSASLDTITVARPPVRVGDPVIEVDDRMARLRLGAWNLARHPHRGSVFDLTEYAVAAVVVHTHLAAHADPAASGSTGLASLARDRAGWVGAVHQLSRLGSAANVTSAVRAEVHALAAAAQGAFPVVRDATGVHADGPRRELPTVTEHLLDACRDIATSSEVSLRAQSAREMLFIHARHLEGDRITDSPALVTAKLEGRFVPASPVDIEPVLAAYAELRPLAHQSQRQPPVLESISMGAIGM